MPEGSVLCGTKLCHREPTPLAHPPAQIRKESVMDKEEYRKFFLQWKQYVKYAPILEEANIQQANFSQFLSGSNVNALSVEKLETVRKRMIATFSQIEKETR